MICNLSDGFFNILAFVGPGGETLRPWLHRVRGVRVERHVWISHFVYIDDLHPEEISIGDDCTIGLSTSIFAHLYWGFKKPQGNGRVVIEKDVFVGPHCVILPNFRIGEGAVIKVGAVASRNVSPHAFCGAPSAEPLGTATVPLTLDHRRMLIQKRQQLKPTKSRQTDDSCRWTRNWCISSRTVVNSELVIKPFKCALRDTNPPSTSWARSARQLD
jgi:acetyltransferase-like isoleucine patch superfamily enzyme